MAFAAVAWLGLALIWGSTWLAVRIGLSDLPPFTFAGYRFLLAFGILAAVLVARRVPAPRRRGDWLLIGTTGFFAFGVCYAAQFWGMQYLPSGMAAVMFSTVPLFTMLFAHFAVPGEPLRSRAVGGVVLGIAGVAVIFSDQLAAPDPMAVWGAVAFVGAAVAMAGAQVAIKARGQHLAPVVLATYQMGIAAVLLLAAAAVVEGNPLQQSWTRTAVLSLTYLSVMGSVVGFLLFYWLLKRIAVTKTLSVLLTHPPTAIVLGWVVLGERLGSRTFVGAAAIMLGLTMILRPFQALRRRGVVPIFATRDRVPAIVGANPAARRVA